MFCSNCGNNVPEGANVCPMCGKPVVQQPQQPYGQPNMYNGQSQQPYGQPNMYNGQPQQPYGQPNMYNGQPQQPYGQPNMYNGQPQQPYGQPNMYNGQPQPPMNWYKFIIYFQLFACALLNTITGIMYLTGAHYQGKADLVYAFFAGLRAVDIIMGIIVLGMAALAIYVRQCLAHYKAGAPMKYVILLTINAVVSLLYVIIASIIIGKSALTVSVISNIVGTIVVAALSYTYFQKRKFMFTR